ncbi:HNH endonuclease [Massilia eurypsychrophila]|uniref:HNH endonuclease n=1 Tax=Massilia eurypsychrophila TaxID=1485217 RepID=A0A2G8TKR2_9BURK|nr:HNH endonuclease [Massilia eurypsychrophila]PIL46640.1 HNH endonuclease [Massilia eurypsychrophila]
MQKISVEQTKKKVFDWTDQELSCAVEAYLHALRDELTATPYRLKDVITTLQETSLPNRSWRSVELRLQNISSVLYDLKYPLIPNCVPARNVGSGVKPRIIALLYGRGLLSFEVYVKTADRDVLEMRVSSLRKRNDLNFPMGSPAPESANKNVKTYVRDPAVKAWVLMISKGICEGCEAQAHFAGRDGLPYLEVHHVLPLSKRGSDKVTNAVALCPNCHMRCHHSIDRDEFKIHLYQSIRRLILEVPEPVVEKTDEFVDFD